MEHDYSRAWMPGNPPPQDSDTAGLQWALEAESLKAFPDDSNVQTGGGGVCGGVEGGGSCFTNIL
jgi:hypothetical protein